MGGPDRAGGGDSDDDDEDDDPRDARDVEEGTDSDGNNDGDRMSAGETESILSSDRDSLSEDERESSPDETQDSPGDTTIIIDESRSFDRLNDAAMLSTPELSSFNFDPSSARAIAMDDFHGESENEGYETANSAENSGPSSTGSEGSPNALTNIKVSKLLTPITPLNKSMKVVESATSTPLLGQCSNSAAESLHLHEDGEIVKVVISKTGARIPVRRSSRVCNQPKP